MYRHWHHLLRRRCVFTALASLVAFANLSVLKPLSSLAADPAPSQAAGKVPSMDSEKSASTRANTAGSDSDATSTSSSGATVSEFAKSRSISHYWLANGYFRRWNLDLSAVELEEAIMYWPGLLAAHRDLCLVNLCRGHLGRAVAELMMVVGLGEPIPLSKSEQDALNKKATQLHYQQALKYGYERNWDEAALEFQWALSYKPTDANIYRSLAFAFGNTGNFDKAEEFYQTTFQLCPRDAFSHADFAFMLSGAGRKKRATQQLAEAVALEPSAAALHVDLGWMAEANGDLPTAAREFNAAVALSPKHGGLWLHLGRILERQGLRAEAINAYSEALTIDPGQDEARKSLSRLQQLGAAQKGDIH